MLLNFFVAFILPVSVSLFLFRRYLWLYFTIFPFSAIVAYIFNFLGSYFDFWVLKPIMKDDSDFSFLPFNIGLYPVLGSLFVLSLKKRKKFLSTFLFFSIVTTFLEFIYLMFDRVVYSNGWNIFCTFISYVLFYSFISIFAFFLSRYIKKHNLNSELY